MTTEERVQSIEEKVKKHDERLERHSERLAKLERNSEDLAEVKMKVTNMEADVKKMKAHQTITDKKLMRKSNWTIGLLCCIVGLIIYIAFKSPTTAKDIVEITGKTVVQGITAL